MSSSAQWSAVRFGREVPLLLGTMGQNAPSPPTTERGAEGGMSPAGWPAERTPRPHRTAVYVGIGVAIVVVMVVLAYVLVIGSHTAGTSSGTQGKVLAARSTSYSLSIGAFNGINFVVSSESQIQGEVNSSRGIQVYIFTPSEFQYLVKNLTVGQYVWTSGIVADQAVFDLVIPVQPGQWVLSFVNPNVNFPTGVTLYSDLTLTTD